MTDIEIKNYNHRRVKATLTDGSTSVGVLDVTPEPGLYHVIPWNTAAGGIQRFGPLADLYTEDFLRIDVLL